MASPAPIRPADACCVVPFEPRFAGDVASWATDDTTTRWLAPGTPPPLTREKVADWACADGDRYVMLDILRERPLGYAELNPFRPARDQYWLGHVVLAPTSRGRGLGTRFTAALLDRAFRQLFATRVLLLVFPDNVVARRCYERVGFRPDGEEQRFFEHCARDYRFLRMALDARRYRELRARQLLPANALLFGRAGPTLGAAAVV